MNMPRDFAQPGQSLAHVVFYGLAAYAEGPGYLVVGEVVKAVHGEYPAALFGHGVDGQLHQFEKVGGGDFFLGLGGGLLRIVYGGRHICLRYSPMAEYGENGVACHGEQVGFQRLDIGYFVTLLPQVYEYVVGHVVGIAFVLQESHGEVAHLCRIADIEHSERVGIAALHQIEQSGVADVHGMRREGREE